MDGHLARWREDLASLQGLKVFFGQCGWTNFARLGGPTILACRTSPGSLPSPALLARQISEQGVDIVVVDPNTPPEYAEEFRRSTSAKVIVVPSSLTDLPGATGYPDLFDNLIKRLREAGGRDNADHTGS
jgi:ABC-type Zn uptake system ZnuABC Zn-binding protein ZnuA